MMLTTSPSVSPAAAAYCSAFVRAESTASIRACSSTDSGSANENVTPPIVNPGPAACWAASIVGPTAAMSRTVTLTLSEAW